MNVVISRIPRQNVRDKIIKAMDGTVKGDLFTIPCGDGFSVKLINNGDDQVIIPVSNMGRYVLNRMWTIKRLSTF